MLAAGNLNFNIYYTRPEDLLQKMRLPFLMR
jgi:hypothetical protein